MSDTWNEYITTDPRRLAQRAINDAIENQRRIAKDDSASIEAFSNATDVLRKARAHLDHLNRQGVKGMFN